MNRIFLASLAHALFEASKGKTKHEIDALTARALDLLKAKKLSKRSGELLFALAEARRSSEGRILVKVESASALTATQRSAVREYAEKHFKKDVELAEVLRPELLGGFRLLCGDTVIDATVRSHIKQLAAHLTR